MVGLVHALEHIRYVFPGCGVRKCYALATFTVAEAARLIRLLSLLAACRAVGVEAKKLAEGRFSLTKQFAADDSSA